MKARRTSIDDLTAVSNEIKDDHLRWVSGSSGTQRIEMDPIFVYPMPSSCTYGDTRAGDYD